MSLLTSVNGGTVADPYFHVNAGAQAQAGFPVPVILGSSIGTVRLGDASGGMILRGDPTTGNGSIRGGAAAGCSLTLGASTSTAASVILTDTALTTTLPITTSGAASDLNVGGNIVMSNGATGKSTSGYYNTTSPGATYPDVADTPLTTPAGLTTGWYILSMAAPPGSQNEQQVSTIVHYNASSGEFDIGGSIRSTAGAGDFGFKPSINRTQMEVHNSTGFPQANIVVYWVKLLN